MGFPISGSLWYKMWLLLRTGYVHKKSNWKTLIALIFGLATQFWLYSKTEYEDDYYDQIFDIC